MAIGSGCVSRSQEQQIMERRIQIGRLGTGSWVVDGLPAKISWRFKDLPTALEYAKADCGAEPAVIELLSTGF
jgi:hypothetical protein